MRNYIILLILLLIIININKEKFNNYKYYSQKKISDDTFYDNVANKYISKLKSDPVNDPVMKKKIWTQDEINKVSTKTLDNSEINSLKIVESTSIDPQLSLSDVAYSYDNAQDLIDIIKNQVRNSAQYNIPG